MSKLNNEFIDNLHNVSLNTGLGDLLLWHNWSWLYVNVYQYMEG